MTVCARTCVRACVRACVCVCGVVLCGVCMYVCLLLLVVPVGKCSLFVRASMSVFCVSTTILVCEQPPTYGFPPFKYHSID